MKKFKNILIIFTFIFGFFIALSNTYADETHVNIDYDSNYVKNIIDINQNKINLAENLAENFDLFGYKYSIVIHRNYVDFIIYKNINYTQIRPMFSGGFNNKIEGKPDDTIYIIEKIEENSEYETIKNNINNKINNNNWENGFYWRFFNSSYSIFGDNIPNKTFNLYEDSKEYRNYECGIIYDTNLNYIEIISTSNFLPISFNNGDIKGAGDHFLTYKQVMNKTPSMNLKGMYNSNDEDIYEIGKVSVYFQESDSTIEEFKYAKFRLQYISNDISEENIPIFSHFKIYGKINDESDAAEYEEINLNDFIYEDEDDEGNIIEKSITFEVGDTEYDYVPDKLAMSMLEFKLNFLENVNTIYEYWKIEFYFDNSQNATINVYDSLENSEWRNEPKFLDEYDFYYFPSNFKYAYISSENFENIGRVYFPTNSTINPEILLQAQYFNINTKTYDSPLEIIEYNDSFYSYIDFNFNNSTQLLVLNRLYGTETPNLNYFTGNIFLDWFSDILLNNFNAKKFFEYNKELTYFYVPKGYTVVFSDGKGTYQINTGNGFITIDENNNINIHEINENKKSFTLNSILDKFTNLLSDSTKHLKIVKDVWNKIIDSDIGIYILCVIISSIIILIVKSLKR